jgi:glycine/D-amino acid oxidase-like deaminating enzyme
MLEVNGTADVVTCRTPLVAGMDVRPQLAMPSPSFDLRAPLQNMAFRLFGPELYYRVLTRPAWANQLWMQFLSHMAGRGRLAHPDSAPEPLPYERRRVPLLVVGGGVAGIGAALEAAERGTPVLLVDRGVAPGGALRRWAPFSGPGDAFDPLPEPLPVLPPSIQVLSSTTVLGLYEGRTALAVGQDAAYLIHYDSVVVAAGCYPRALAMPGADEPLFLPVQGVLRAMTETPWRPTSIVLLDADGHGADWADALQAAGVPVDLRPIAGDAAALEGMRAQCGAATNQLRLPTGEVLEATVCSWSAGSYARTELIRQAGGQVSYNEQTKSFVPLLDVHGQVTDGVYACGGCAGITGFAAALAHGRQIGAAATAGLATTREPLRTAGGDV